MHAFQTKKVRHVKAPGSLGIVWRMKRSRVLPGWPHDKGIRNVAIVQSKHGPAAAEGHLSAGDKLVAVISSTSRQRIPVVGLDRQEIMQQLEGHIGETAILEFLKAGEICPDEKILFAPQPAKGSNTFTIRLVREPHMTQSYFSMTEPARSRTRSYSAELPEIDSYAASHLAWELKNAQKEQDDYFKDKVARRESRVQGRIERMRRMAEEMEAEEARKAAAARPKFKVNTTRRPSQVIDTGLALQEVEGFQRRLNPVADHVARAEVGEWKDLRRMKEVPDETSGAVRVLNMEGGKLTHVPDHVANFHALEELYLGNNRVAELPSWLGELQHLKVLGLSNNMLQHLPLELGRLRSSLRQLALDGNPALITPPRLVLQQCTLVRQGYVDPLPVLEYLAECEEASEWNLHFAVTVVGPAEAGKTSLLHCLRRSKAEQLLVTDRTYGVEMTSWYVYHEQLSICLTEVSGQSSYAPINHLFFLRRSLYIYVWSALAAPGVGPDAHAASLRADLARWMWNLQASVPQAEVLLVVTHVDRVGAAELSRAQKMMQAEATRLGKKVGKLVRLQLVCEGRSLPIDCRTGLGVRDIREQIYNFCKQRDMYRGRVPRSLEKLRERLDREFQSRACIAAGTVDELAAECGLTGQHWPRTALLLLSQMGHALKLELPGSVPASMFVSPKWLSRVLARLFQHERGLLAASLIANPDRQLIGSLVALDLRGNLHENIVSVLWPTSHTVPGVNVQDGQHAPARTASGQERWAVQKGGDDVRVALCQDNAVMAHTLCLLEGLDLLLRSGESKAHDGEVYSVPALQRAWGQRVVEGRVFQEWEAAHRSRLVFHGALGAPDGFAERMLTRVQRRREGTVVRHPQGLSLYRKGAKTSVWLSQGSTTWTIHVMSTLRSEMESMVLVVADFAQHFSGIERAHLQFLGRIGEWVPWPLSAAGQPRAMWSWRSMTSGDKDADVAESLAKLSLVQQKHAMVFILHSGEPLWPSRSDFEVSLDKPCRQTHWDPTAGAQCMAYRHAGPNEKTPEMFPAEVIRWTGDHVEVKFMSDHSVQSMPRSWMQRNPVNTTDHSVLAIGAALADAGISFDDRASGPFSELRIALIVIDPLFEWSAHCRRCVKAILESRMPTVIAVLSGENGEPPRVNNLNVMFGSDIRQHPHLFDCRSSKHLGVCMPDIRSCLEQHLQTWHEPTWRAEEQVGAVGGAWAGKTDTAKRSRMAVQPGVGPNRSAANITALDGIWEPPHPHLDGVLCAGCTHSDLVPPFAFRAATIYSMWSAASRGESVRALRCEGEGQHESQVTEVLAPEVVVSYCWTAAGGAADQHARKWVQGALHMATPCCCWAYVGGGGASSRVLSQPGEDTRLTFIESARVVVLLLSDQYVRSGKCRQELQRALDRRLEIIPVLLPPVDTGSGGVSGGWQGEASGLWWTHAEALEPAGRDLWGALQMFLPVDLRSPDAMHISSHASLWMVSRVAAAVSRSGYSARCTEAKYAAWAAASELQDRNLQQQPAAENEPLSELLLGGAALMARLPSQHADSIARTLLMSESAVAVALCSSIQTHQLEAEVAELDTELRILLSSVSGMWCNQLLSTLLTGTSTIACVLRTRLAASLAEGAKELSKAEQQRLAWVFNLFASGGGIAREVLPAALAEVAGPRQSNAIQSPEVPEAIAVEGWGRKTKTKADFEASPAPTTWEEFRLLGAALFVNMHPVPSDAGSTAEHADPSK